MEALSRWVLARRRLVGLLTLTLLLAGGAAIALLLPQVSERNAYPGLPGYEANQRITATFGTGGYERPVVPVVTLPEGATADSARAELARAFGAVTAATGARVASYADTGDRGFVGTDRRTTFGLVFGGPVEQGGLPGSALGEGAGLEPAIDAAMRPHLPEGSELRVTGLDALATGADTGGLNVPIKLLITIGAAVLVLAWVFRSALALVPLLTAAIAIPVSFLGLLAASLVIEIHETTLIMLPLFGIGIGIDYALILVSRWREERAKGMAGDEAVHRAMATAGHAVLFSAGAVAIGLLTMVVLPIPLLRSLGVGGMLVTLASAAVSLTVLPLLLARAQPGSARAEGRAWFSWARLVVRFRGVAAVLAAGALLALSAAALDLNLRVPTTDHLATEGPGRDGLTVLERNGIPSGVLTSFDVYLSPGTAVEPVRATLGRLPGVHAVTAPVHRDGAALLTVLPVAEGGSAAGEATIERVVAAMPGALVGGNVRQQMDYVRVTYTAFPWMLAVLALLSYVLLARAFRSLLLPLKAILLNLLSLGAVLGAMVLLWQWGWGTEALLGLRPDGAIGTFVPVTIFAFLYGLTMDYEVFLIARMREEHDRTGDTERAVVEGIGRTGRLVTSAALILFCSFAAMAAGGELDVAIFASGVALGILLDATLIRSVLVPATVAMLGRWNWWLPSWAARVLRVPVTENTCR
ncbi:MMPL family transporter [Crossiella sp. NPDC003009]